ncbi:MAG: hypothetical protein Kow0042_25020 [Calditrichia bacterium]
MNLLVFFYIPLLAGLIALIFPRRWKYAQEICAALGGLLFLAFAIRIFYLPDQNLIIPWFSIPPLDFSLDFRLVHFSKFISIFLGLFALLTVLYSAYYFQNRKISPLFYPFILWTLAAAVMVVLADNFFTLLLGWEISTLFLFFLIAMGQGKSASMAAGKAFAILGFTDVALLFAVIAIPLVYGTWKMSGLNIVVSDPLSISIYLMIFTAAVAKAGAMPFHSWIPPACQHAPLPSVAFLPAALDKLLGIYLLARLSLDIFVLNEAMLTIMLILGAITLIMANFMALIQNDLKKMLGFATIAQVGYMLIGFGTGTVIGIIGGLFHMLNHALYKSLAFFGIGVIETETGTTDMDKLGGLAKSMPITFGLTTIGVFAASGIPPFNAFVSKWMVFQSTLDAGKPLYLIIAMFGSALTLATFLKMWFACFLGSRPATLPSTIKDGSLLSHVTLLVPALLCTLFGIFAQIPLNHYITPIVGQKFPGGLQTIHIGTAFYNPTLATGLLLLGLLLGALFFALGRIPKREVETLFIGGERFQVENHRYLADELFESLKKIKFVGTALREGDKGVLDVYNLSSNFGQIIINVLKKAHDGVLSTYLAWCVIGLGILSFILVVMR